MNFQIEFTNRCNLSCVECPNRLMERNKTIMPSTTFDIIKTYIEALKPKTIITSKDGEPLLNPDFRYILRQIADISDAKIDIYTNGLFLTKPFCDFLSTLPNGIRVLLSYHFYNYNGTKNNYDKKTWDFKEIFLDNSYANIEFILASHVNRFASKEFLMEWKGKWEEWKESEKSNNLSDIHVNTCINPWAGRIHEAPELMGVFPSCPYADGEHMFFGVTGNVLPCCIDLEEDIVLGNVHFDSREEIMKQRNIFYKDIRNDCISYSLCNRCLGR